MERANQCVDGCLCDLEREVAEDIARGKLVLTLRGGYLVALPPRAAQ